MAFPISALLSLLPTAGKIAGGFAGGLSGGSRQQVNTSTSTSLSAAVNPNIFVSLGDGQVSPVSGGSASASGTSPISASQDDRLPAGFFGQPPLGALPGSGRVDLSAAGPGDGGLLAGLFSDPTTLLLIAGGVALFAFSGGK